MTDPDTVSQNMPDGTTAPHSPHSTRPAFAASLITRIRPTGQQPAPLSAQHRGMSARSKTGGGVGTNQHAIKGRSAGQDDTGQNRAAALDTETERLAEIAALREAGNHGTGRTKRQTDRLLHLAELQESVRPGSVRAQPVEIPAPAGDQRIVNEVSELIGQLDELADTPGYVVILDGPTNAGGDHKVFPGDSSSIDVFTISYDRDAADDELVDWTTDMSRAAAYIGDPSARSFILNSCASMVEHRDPHLAATFRHVDTLPMRPVAQPYVAAGAANDWAQQMPGWHIEGCELGHNDFLVVSVRHDNGTCVDIETFDLADSDEVIDYEITDSGTADDAATLDELESGYGANLELVRKIRTDMKYHGSRRIDKISQAIATR